MIYQKTEKETNELNKGQTFRKKGILILENA